jgi:SsrA-binding protein
MAGKSKDKAKTGEVLVCKNTKATHRYDVEERFEAGMVLKGSEVKSLRLKHAELDGAYASIDGGELYLHKAHIAPYEQAGPYLGHEPKTSRKLLVHRAEIEKLRGRISLQGYTLIPLRLYFKDGNAKVELGVCKVKKKGDDRESMKREQEMKEARAAMDRVRR